MFAERLDSARLGVALTVLLGAPACITTQTINVGQKTALERQLMGELEPLTEEQLLAASVRASQATVASPKDEAYARALAARRRQVFNRDDLDELKTAGCLGEARGARLEARPCADAGRDAGLRDKLVAEENEDRLAIIDWVLVSDSTLTAADRPQVVDMYQRLLAEKARPGDWIQGADGTWSQR